MVGGQAADLKHQKKKVKLDELSRINALKTGCLITASCETGALWAGAASGAVKKLKNYGQEVGFLFQLVDDIIDGDGYVPLMGACKTYELAAKVRDRAKASIRALGPQTSELVAFADFLFERKA
jgi:geranylgeranyl pyrophosphate synthase